MTVPFSPSIEALQSELLALRQQVAQLQREKSEQALVLEMTTEHADDVTEELQELTERLKVHSRQLELSAQIGQQITSILDLDTLLPEIVRTIQQYFGYYFVGVWLLNATRDALVLQAESSHEQSQIKPGFVLFLETESIIVNVWQQRQRYYASDVSADPTYHYIAELPATCSELGLPLQVGTEVLGVLDIQSEYCGAFAESDCSTLQMLANQVAIAIHNARLYAEAVHFSELLEQQVCERTHELEGANHILEQMDRIKTNFIEVAAHELRTPLTLIRGYAGLLQSLIQEDEEAISYLRGIHTGQARLLEVVNSLLDVSRIDGHALDLLKKPVGLFEILVQLRFEFESALNERHLIVKYVDLEGLPPVVGDAGLLHKLFYHLMVNAIKYTPDGGVITVQGKGVLRERADLAKPAIEIVVADTGIGIDPAYHTLIFERFFQTGDVRFHSTGKTKFKGGGPGLGLSIVRGIIEAHGGAVWVESPGYDEINCPGSAFHVLLPIFEV